ncbi:MAG TPA: alpha/beta hydrolase [Pseudonocardiaceae bacterium]|jgi:acetyl esterase|nr:alpha/beta hydrolase [Pseudonocardiaceae bacterium]
MTLDPELSAFLTAADPGPATGRTVQERRTAIRSLSDSLFATFSETAGDVHTVDEHLVAVPGGHIRLRVYRPSAEAGLPIHVFFHGGGWWLGSIDEDVVDATCRERCLGARCVVVAAEYRLAPEHRFPTAVEDCYAALLWSHAHAGEIGGDPDTISVGGVSAGANLAAATAIAARDRHGPRPVLQLLEVPPVDLTLGLARTVPVGDEFGISVAAMEENVTLYLRSPADARDPLASPALVDDVRGLAPARIQTAEFDPLRRDGEFYADRLRDAGVPVSFACYPGAIHGSLSMTRTWAPARQWRQDLIDQLVAAHGRGTATRTTDVGSGG